MPITKEQIESFSRSPIPDFVRLKRVGNQVLRGKEALTTRAVNEIGQEVAFKEYGSLSGKSIDELVGYADGVNQDEAHLRKLTLTSGQVPDSHFFIGGEKALPKLYAIQTWIEGRALRDVPLTEIFRNKRLRRNLGALFVLCGRLYQKEGITPDLTGGKRLNLFGHDVVDPTGFLWPFRTTNVIIQGDKPVLVDAKHNSSSSHPIKRLAVMTHHYISRATGEILIRT